MANRNILLIGLLGNLDEPDYLKGKYGNSEDITTKIRADVARAESAGYHCTSFRIDPAEQDKRTGDFEALLKAEKFDAVMFGAGLRVLPAYSVLFETLINISHRTAPQAPFLFNNGPDSIYEGLQRQFGQ